MNKEKENIDLILGIESVAPQEQHTPPPFPYQTMIHAFTPEKVLNVLAIIVLVLGLLSTAYFFLSAAMARYDEGKLLLFGLGSLFSTLLTWGLLKLSVQIAKTLREINSKLK